MGVLKMRNAACAASIKSLNLPCRRESAKCSNRADNNQFDTGNAPDSGPMDAPGRRGLLRNSKKPRIDRLRGFFAGYARHFQGYGRQYWIRTSDLYDVNVAL